MGAFLTQIKSKIKYLRLGPNKHHVTQTPKRLPKQLITKNSVYFVKFDYFQRLEYDSPTLSEGHSIILIW